MGQIDKVIYQNYQKALEKGDLDQARRSVKLARYFKDLVEKAGFIDYKLKTKPKNNISFQEPITYKFYPTTNFVFINNTQISLTETESKLFELFSQNESSLENIHLITDVMIKQKLWPEKDVTPQAIRVAVKRLKDKIEKDFNDLDLIQNIYSKGYLFWGKRIY